MTIKIKVGKLNYLKYYLKMIDYCPFLKNLIQVLKNNAFKCKSIWKFWCPPAFYPLSTYYHLQMSVYL
jgi:hypothetical protein